MIALSVGTVVGYILFEPIVAAALAPVCGMDVLVDLGGDGESCALLVLEPLEAFSVRIKTSLAVGLFVGGPVIFYQLWRFITPGLTDRERRLALPFVVFSQLMFAAGIVFSWFVIPQGLRILLNMGGDQLEAALTATKYLEFFLRTSVAFGLVFELPLILMFLALVGVVTASSLRKYRRYSIVINMVVAAVITPTTDPLTLFLMAGPMVVFYELAIVFAWFIERRRARRNR